MFESLWLYRTNPLVKRIAAAAAGACAGFAYYYYIGCASGTCPITGNPYISTAYGGLIGYLLFPTRKEKQPTKDPGTANEV
jgi:Family of unknown function (DUF6132)